MDSPESAPKEITAYASKPLYCPSCGHSPVAAILYGDPAESPELERKREAGLVYFGGVKTWPNPPRWRCSKCGQKMHLKTESLESAVLPEEQPSSSFVSGLPDRGSRELTGIKNPPCWHTASTAVCPERPMNTQDEIRFAELEKRLMGTLKVYRISDIVDFPYSNLADLKAAAESKTISLGVRFNGDLMTALGTRTENNIYMFWGFTTPAACLAFVVAAFITGKFMLLWGILFAFVGFLISSPGCAAKFLAPLAVLSTIYLAFLSPMWAWIVGGLVAGYVFSSAVRCHFADTMEKRALSSEVFFCFLREGEILFVKDNRTGQFI